MDLISIVFIFCTLQLLSFVCLCVFIYEDFRVDFGHVLLSGHVPVDKKEQTPKLSYLHTIFKRLRLPKNREKRKRGRRFFDHETTETFDDGALSIHTDTRHQHHHHHGFYYCFKYRSRRAIICESSSSLVFDSSSFFSLSLSLSARANASRPCEQIIYSAFLSISEKMYYHTQAQQQPQQQRTKVVSRASAPPTCSLSMRPAHAQTAITDDANADVGCDSKTEMAKTKCVHPERKDKSTWCKDCPRRG